MKHTVVRLTHTLSWKYSCASLRPSTQPSVAALRSQVRVSETHTETNQVRTDQNFQLFTSLNSHLHWE